MREEQKRLKESINGQLSGNGNDMFGALFAEKKNISLEKRMITDKKIDLIKD